jgi:hypothetical protein
MTPGLMSNAHGRRIARTLDDIGHTHTETN